MTQVEALAHYAARASFADLSVESRQQLPVHILDSVGCCIAALGAGPVEACREQVSEFGGIGPCTLIGGGKANAIYAAFWNTALVRYVDFMDNFLAPTETCHTADNFGVALTIADYVGGSGRDLMLGVALGYTVQSRLVDHANFMSSGLDHTTQLAFSHNAAAGRLLGLSEQQIAHAIAMAAVSDASFAVVRAKPLSQWKGLASAQSALGSMNTLFLARRDVKGPLRVVEGPLGIDHLLRMKINIDWDKQGYEGVVGSTIKKYNAMIHTQSAVHCMVELASQNKIDPAKVISIEAEVFQLAYDFAGGGLYGVDKVIRTKEQADHSLPYLLAVALLDGDVMPAQFKPDRIVRADVQGLLKKVSVRPNHEYTDEYPEKMPAKITVRLQDGKVIEHQVQDYPGLASRPFTWDDSVEKFDRLVADRVDEGLGCEIKDAVRSVDNIRVRDLMKLLGRATASKPETHHRMLLTATTDTTQRGENEMAITPENVREIFKGLETGDGAGFFKHVADDVDWIVEGTHPLAGHYNSKKAFIEGTFAKLAQVLPQGAELETEHVLVKDDQAVVELHSLATARNGMRFDNRYCWVVYFQDGVIVRVRAYLDSAMVARLFEENPIAPSTEAA
jgi:2-methylcitrate dehydratase